MTDTKGCVMANRNPNYLLKRNGVYYFRRFIPVQLIAGRKGEIKLSLRTKELDEAKRRCTYLASFINQMLYMPAKDNPPTLAELKELAREYFEKLVSHRNEVIYFLANDPELNVDIEISGTREDVKEHNERLQKHNYKPSIYQDAKTTLEQNNYTCPQSSDEYFQYTEMLARAQAEADRIYLAIV